MTEPQKQKLAPVVRRFVEDLGTTTQSFGYGRIVGQIYAFLYFSSSPRTLDNMQEFLGISKGSASTNVRQLERWEAARKVWVKGDRKDYYEANTAFERILKNVGTEMVYNKLGTFNALLDEAGQRLEEVNGNGDKPFIEERVAGLRKFHTFARSLWNNPLLQRLLK